MKTKIRQKGFTLTEAMMVTSIFMLVSVGISTFLVDSTKSIFWVTKKALISKDVRLFTMRISRETLGANAGYVYPDYKPANRDARNDRRDSDETGDCLVLVHKEPYPDIIDDKHYSKIVVYYREPDADGRGPVYRVEKTFDPPVPIDNNEGFEKFLSAHFPAHDSATSEIVLELSRGLADGKLFHNLGNNSFVINGEIVHGNEVKEVTNTYNLTISPRG